MNTLFSLYLPPAFESTHGAVSFLSSRQTEERPGHVCVYQQINMCMTTRDILFSPLNESIFLLHQEHKIICCQCSDSHLTPTFSLGTFLVHVAKEVKEWVLKQGNESAFYHFLAPRLDINVFLNMFLVVGCLVLVAWNSFNTSWRGFKVLFYDINNVSKYPHGECKKVGC